MIYLKTYESFSNNVEWVKPSLEDEKEEFYNTPFKFNDVKEIYDEANIELLSNEDWDNLQNTDSNDPRLKTEEDIYDIVTEYGREKERIFKYSIEPIKNGGIVETPIVVYPKEPIPELDGTPSDKVRPYLVAGNTRLMACKVFGVTPMVTKIFL